MALTDCEDALTLIHERAVLIKRILQQKMLLLRLSREFAVNTEDMDGDR